MLPISTKDLITAGIIVLAALPCLALGLWLGQHFPALGLVILAFALVALLGMLYVRKRLGH